MLIQFPGLVFQKATPTGLLIDGADDDDDDNNDANSFVTMADLSDAGEEMNQLTTPRTIENLSKWLNRADRNELAAYLQTPSVVQGRETTVLNEIVEAKVGNTMFATQVIAAIAEDLASGPGGGATTPRVNVPKPNCYADLKRAGTVTDLDALIATLTQNEMACSLLYAPKGEHRQHAPHPVAVGADRQLRARAHAHRSSRWSPAPRSTAATSRASSTTARRWPTA